MSHGVRLGECQANQCNNKPHTYYCSWLSSIPLPTIANTAAARIRESQDTDPFGPPWRGNAWRLLFSHWRGSIFQFFWFEWLLATGTCAVALTMWWIFLRDGMQVQNKYNLDGFVDSVDYILKRFQVAMSMMLGFYTSTLYGRWWKVRVCEGVAISGINDIALQIAAMVRDNNVPRQGETLGEGAKEEKKEGSIIGHSPDDDKNDHSDVTDAAQVRMHLVRWLNLSHALAVGELYEKRPNEFVTLDYLLEIGLMTPYERKYMDAHPRSRYMAPFVWFLDLIHELRDRGECRITESSILLMAGNITKIRGSLKDLYMYRNVPVPLSYRQLVNATVRMYACLLAISGGTSAFKDEDQGDGTYNYYISPAIYWFLLSFFFEFFMFVGWLSLADALGNPFRTWADEFDWENYVRTVCLSSSLLVSATKEAAPGVARLGSMTDYCEQRLVEARADWEEMLGEEEEKHILLRGVEETCQAKDPKEVKQGFRKVRNNLTGY